MAREVALVTGRLCCMVAMMVATMVARMVVVAVVKVGLAPILVQVTQTSDTVPSLETLGYSPARHRGFKKSTNNIFRIDPGGLITLATSSIYNQCNLVNSVGYT